MAVHTQTEEPTHSSFFVSFARTSSHQSSPNHGQYTSDKGHVIESNDSTNPAKGAIPTKALAMLTPACALILGREAKAAVSEDADRGSVRADNYLESFAVVIEAVAVAALADCEFVDPGPAPAVYCGGLRSLVGSESIIRTLILYTSAIPESYAEAHYSS
ncbi:hypothetical protein MMC15_005239 [Xylographa vitiligo]|nr:hypothetical protein [Xylographa vitiligo]